MNEADRPSEARQLGDFTLIEEIGRGGMGVVYRAEQGSTGRQVALKVLPTLNSLDDAAVVRFRREAEAARRLSHPGIVPIRAVGEAEGVHFFAMDLVDGPSLELVLMALRSHRPDQLGGTLFDESGVANLSPELAAAQPGRSCVGWRYAASCAHIVAEVADALACVHEAGVIHRDVKPSNVLLATDGRPVLVDFGLARDERAVDLTRSGDKLGTPAYMAPEQASGCRGVDCRVDVYGLGVTLYELLTLQAPFQADGEAELARRIIEDAPKPVRQLNPRVPGPLARIVECCLAKDPDDRYATVAALAADLRACLEGRRVAARRPALQRRLRRAISRHRGPAFVGGLVVAAASVAALSMGFATHHEARRDAMVAMAEGAAHLRAGRTNGAEIAYGRASAVLTESAVEEARRRDALAMFEARYEDERFDELVAIFREWPAAPRAPFWDTLLARAEGRGWLEIPQSATPLGGVRIGAVDDGGAFRWRTWRAEDPLPIGPHLVLLQSVGFAVTAKLIHVERDRVVHVDEPRVPASDVPTGFVVASDDPERGGLLIAKTETSAGEYARLLRGIEDVDLRSELLPDGWRDPVARPGVDSPVRGLSFVQARTVAAMLGAHLPSVDEQRLAASSGLGSLAWPWGRAFAWSRVAAAPDGLAEPLPVGEKSVGAAPCGALDLVGNVREFVTDEGLARAVGGHFASTDPAELRVDVGPTVPLDEVDPFTGFRLARFLAPADDPGAAAREERLRARTPGSVHEWAISPGGEIALRVERGPSIRPSEMAPSDMIPAGATDRAWPTTALVQRSSSYELQLPRGGSSLCRVTLPIGSRVDGVEPAPALSYHALGRPVLVWALPDEAQDAVYVRFRRDGFLTDEWPTREPSFQVAERFLEALSAPNRPTLLASLVSERFVWRPHGVGFDALSGPGRFGGFASPRFVDVTAVGPVVSVFVLVDRVIATARGEEVSIHALPMVVQFDRRDGRVLALASEAGEDDGRLIDGRYENAGLGVEITAPAGVRLRRVRGAPLELQLSCTSEMAPPGVSVEVRGSMARPGETPAAALHRLTNGVAVARSARLLRDPVSEPFGPRDRLRSAVVSEWQVGHAGDECVARERWYLLARDRRWFLVRLVATGADRGETEARFRDAASSRLLDAVADSLSLP